ncbi:AraC family transcriptional regulator [Pseudomonas sp. MAFF 302030]|uniref:AraC family transcriptional regulator n=1 Tax=Pseudomonas morbosilactucae TaxID=2938197 RepID=A0A9X1YQ27_9PSED|nr:AraC family transcriptional regulator [Pseudomonas morbosilactucae]MCK9796306.1 AraC family transcriptional regulator [Pseudomonas morbosilactucae]
MHRMTCARFQVLADVMREGGAQPDALLRQFGSNPQEVHGNPKGVRLELVYQMLHEATRVSGNPDLGLLAYGKAHPAHLASLGYALMSCATLDVALQRMVEYHSLTSNGLRLCLERKPQALKIIGFDAALGPPLMPRAFIDAVMAQILGLVHWLLPQHKPRPLAVAFTYPEPADSRPLRQLLGDELSFNAPYNSLTFSAADCATALPTADPALDVLLMEYARRHLNLLLNDSMSARVRRILAERLAQGASGGLEQIAQVIGVSARSLQRRLGQEDVHFSALQDEARLMLAHNFLRNSARSVKYIGALLGFRDQSSFHKACMRWFGMTPGRYRSDC